MKHNIGISGIRVKSNSLLLAFFLLLVWCVQIVPDLRNTYAQCVYPIIARVLFSFSRLVPFAIGDLFVALSTAGLPLYPVYACHIRKQRWKSIPLTDAKYLLRVYVWFYLARGLNYSQRNFYERTHIPYITYTPENLREFVDSYIRNLDGSYTDITSINRALVCHESVRIYNQISDLSGVHRPFHQSPRVKAMLFTPLTSVVGVAGSMGPFFYEFTLNGDLFPSQYPTTYVCGLAHLLGITSEAEASFYTYQVCTRSQVREIRFSDYFSILSHMLGNVRRLMSEEEYAQLPQRIRPEIARLAQTNSEYWMKKYNPVISNIQSRIYGLYLEGNRIESGRKNYSEVVGLPISYKEWKKNRIFAPIINQQ